MKKEFKKGFYLVAMIASLALLWGGVISCSNGSDDDENENWDGTPPSAVMLQGYTDADKTWKDDLAAMKKSTEGEIWTAELTLSDQQWPNFGVKATANEKDFYFKGGSDGTEAILGEETKTTENGSGDIWCNVGEENKNTKILVTVDFTKADAPTIKIEVKQDENEGTPITPEKPTITLPTAVELNNKIDGSSWQLVTMTKSKDGIWTAELTLSNQWPNFNVKAKIEEQDVWYKSESKDGTEAKLGTPVEITKDGKGDIWLDVGVDNSNAKILVTVDFTNPDAPTIKIATTE